MKAICRQPWYTYVCFPTVIFLLSFSSEHLRGSSQAYSIGLF